MFHVLVCKKPSFYTCVPKTKRGAKKMIIHNIWDKVCYYGKLGKQIGNVMNNHWALGENMKKPCGIHLGLTRLGPI